MSKAQRDKGRRGEQMAVRALKPIFPDAARDLNDVYAKNGIDLIGTGNLAVQVKHYQNHVPLTKMREIVPGERIPALISWPTNRIDDPVIVLKLSDFVRLAQDIGELWK